ncbi:unnamed protein product (macronuclear) [Paramecium tetraurelia]|uniref:Potassium channel domain-containing protein n=1 Tax=Paramecium tetraurelia TaxID=5888 RepID=A0DCH4_PARTE|nr:uncharacterized protein GSPATT00015619001 [Paramecium tetraurelia]CAK80741.1 unnamed protein product [Paramecium tetraurelia]|eukprot:XP_001448138.1 hypothetical protein (macronuclear) [Paramecium tetraurelia strain d4-2]
MNQNDSINQVTYAKQFKTGIGTLGYERSFSVSQEEIQSKENNYQKVQEKEIICFEDSRITKLIMEGHKLIENFRLQLILVITALWFLEIDDEIFIEKQGSDLILWLTFSLNLILILFTFLSYLTLMNYWKSTLLIPKDQSFFHSDQMKPFLIETGFLLIFPTVFTRDIHLTFTLKNNEYYYTVNEIIIMISTLRSFQILFIYLRLCKFYNSQTQRLSLNYGIMMNPKFLFKYLIHSQPTYLIISMFTITFWYCTIAMWIAEKALQRENLQTVQLFKHCFLEVILSLLAYAYEDYVPITNLGRIILSYAAYAGFVMASIIISAIIQAFEQEYGEYQACVLLDKLIMKENMYQVTSNIGEQFYYIMKFDKNPFTYNRVKIIQAELKEFQMLKRQYKSIISENVTNLFKRRSRESNDILDEYQDIMKMCKYQNKQIQEMLEELISLQNYHYHNWYD